MNLSDLARAIQPQDLLEHYQKAGKAAAEGRDRCKEMILSIPSTDNVIEDDRTRRKTPFIPPAPPESAGRRRNRGQFG